MSLFRVRTDMQLRYVYDIPTNYHSRTKLPQYSHLIGSVTPATIRLQGGKGNVALPTKWIDYVNRINNNNQSVMKYLFHENSGWQNSSEYARVEELVFENNVVEVLSSSGGKSFVKTYFANEEPPAAWRNQVTDHLFTVVTNNDTIVGSPKGNAYIVLIARPGEKLWIPTEYLEPVNIILPKSVKVHAKPWLNIHERAGQTGLDGWLGGYQDFFGITILEVEYINNNVWGRTDRGWVALKINGAYLTDWNI